MMTERKNVSIFCDGNGTKYTDIVDTDAGWKTVFVYLWAVRFYSHRQKKRIKMLKR